MESKVILCRCEDVTAADVAKAVKTGFASLEEVKRYTGFGTGPCQGKDCLRLVAEHLAKCSAVPIESLQPFTARPPLVPVPLAALAQAPGKPPEEGTPLPKTPPPPTAPLLRKRSNALAAATACDVAIIGGGIMGLAIAYELAELGITNVVVLEASHLAAGASGRNGGGVRQQWSSALNIELMRESVALCRSFASRLHTNIWMRQGGYLFLTNTATRLARMEKNVALQNECGVPTRMISLREAACVVPELHTEGLLGACYNPTDGIVFPWPFLWGYAAAATAKGVAVHTFCPVTHVDACNDGFTLQTPRGAFAAKRVINAAGAWSGQVAAQLGVSLPTWPARHEIFSTEGLKPFLKPMVSVMDSGLYASQSLRGEIVGGITHRSSHDDALSMARTIALGSQWDFLTTMAHSLVAVLPRLGSVKVVRQWAGPYDHSPDGSPLVGEVREVPGFYVCCGFVGHGFMMAPVVAKHFAAHVAGKATHSLFHTWRPSRFAEGDPISEDWNIG
jgi:sarcosine oxidase subunit beta